MEIRLARLSKEQSAALSAALDLIGVEDGEELTLTANTATFHMAQPRLWLMRASEKLGDGDGRQGDHRSALHAVHRMLNRAITGEGSP